MSKSSCMTAELSDQTVKDQVPCDRDNNHFDMHLHMQCLCEISMQMVGTRTYKIQSTRIQTTGFSLPGFSLPGFSQQDSVYRIQSTGFSLQESVYRIQ